MKKLTLLLVMLFATTVSFSQTTSTSSANVAGRWFISAGAGTLVYIGESDSKADIADRVAPHFELSVGKWVSPLFALRAQFSGLQAKGAVGHSGPFADLGTQLSPGLYQETFNVSYLHIDLMLNFSAWVSGVKQNRFFELLPMVGTGWIHSWKDNSSYSSDNAAFVAGLAGKFRLSNNIDFNIELKGVLVNEDLDGVTGNKNGEGMAVATAGFSIKL